MAFSRACACLALLFACACTAEEEAPYVEAAHVRLYPPQDDGGDCAGETLQALEFLDAAVAAIAGYLELPAPYIEYHWVSPESWPEGTPCAPHALGCTDRQGRVYAKVLSPHELVHAVVVQYFDGFRASFLDEGVAEALGAQPSDAHVAYAAPIGDLLGAEKIEPFDYGAAGHFVSYLLAVHGVERFRRVLERAPRGTSSAELRAIFSSVYGMTPEAIFEEMSGWTLDGLGVAHCGAAPPLPQRGDGITASGAPSCTWPIGAASVELDADGLHRIDWRATSSDASFHLRWCPLSGQGPPFEFFGATSWSAARSTEVAQLRQGRYLLALSGEPNAAGAFDLTEADGGDCARPIELSDQHRQLRVKPGSGAAKTVFFRAASAAGEARVVALDGEVTLELCENCSAHACTRFADRQEVALTPGAVYALRVSTAVWGDEAGLDF